MSGIAVFSHHAMNTWWEVRIAGEEKGYAAQAASAAFFWPDRIESLLSRFREDSEISAIARLAPGGRLKLCEPTFACLHLGAECEAATGSAFSMGATAVRLGHRKPAWHLDPGTREIVVESAPCLLDAGAIGKGFALDRMSDELAEWGVASFLLVSGGSSVLAGEALPDAAGWKVGVGDEPTGREFYLVRSGLGACGFTVKGDHITDPRTGQPASRHARTWALAGTAAVADALSTAWMCMDAAGIEKLCAGDSSLGAAIQLADEKIELIGAMRGLQVVD